LLVPPSDNATRRATSLPLRKGDSFVSVPVSRLSIIRRARCALHYRALCCWVA
jgi:hypothetical protein